MSARKSAAYNVQRTCRSCLSDSNEMISLQKPNEGVGGWSLDSDVQQTVGELMMECADVQFKCDDGLPQNVCHQCVSELRVAFIYRNKCKESDAKLRAFFLQNLPIAEVKLEQSDQKTEFFAEEVNVDHPLEQHWLEDESQQPDVSENDDNWPMSDNDSYGINEPREETENVVDETPSDRAMASDDDEDLRVLARAKCIDGRWPCEICKKTLADRKTLKHHIRRHLGKKLKHCPLCEKAFAKSSHLKRHMRCHDTRSDGEKKTRTRRQVTKCDTREKASVATVGDDDDDDDDDNDNDPDFIPNKDDENKAAVKPMSRVDRKRVERLIRDENSVNDDEDIEIVARAKRENGRWVCEICNKSLADQKTLTLHVRLHIGKKLKRCSVCDKGFAKKNHLLQHMRRHGPKSFQCQECEAVFNSKEARRQHRNENHAKVDTEQEKIDRSAAEDLDGVEINTESELEKLVNAAKIKNGKYVCFVCERSFTDKETLRFHLVIHNTAEMKRCEICGEKIQMSDQFNNHMAWHKNPAAAELEVKLERATSAGEIVIENESIEVCGRANDEAVTMASKAEMVGSRLKCEICEKTLIDRKSLILHIRLHTGKNLHRCKYCQRGFSKRSHLQRHINCHEKKLNPDKASAAKTATAKGSVETVSPIASSAFEMLGQPNLEKNCVCKICRSSFDRITKLRTHIRSHGAADPLLQSRLDGNLNLDDLYQITNSVGCELTLSDSETDADDSDDDDDDLPLKMTTHRSHTCGSCNRTFDRRYKLFAHMNVDHADTKTNDFHRFRCSGCNHSYPNEETLAKHRRDQCDNSLKKFTCKKCGVRFQWASSLDLHASIVHLRQKYGCDGCDRKYLRYQDLERHKKIHDTSQDPDGTYKHICEYCAKPFKQHCDYLRHKTIHNADEKKFTCDICQRKFARKDNMKTHMRVHNPNATPADTRDGYLCVYCGKNFRGSSNLTVHLRRHTGHKPFQCDHCDKTFARNSDMQSHRRTHTGEKPHSCSICHRAFSRSNKLSRHMRTHTGEKPHICAYCGRGFTQSNDLTLHVRRHTGDRPYVCGICGARFIQNSLLTSHRRAQNHFEEESSEPKLPPNSVNNVNRYCNKQYRQSPARPNDHPATSLLELRVSPANIVTTQTTSDHQLFHTSSANIPMTIHSQGETSTTRLSAFPNPQ